jgi:hypothetical protein
MSKHTASTLHLQAGSIASSLGSFVRRQTLVAVLMIVTGMVMLSAQQMPITGSLARTLSIGATHSSAIHLHPWGCGSLPLPC